MKPLSPVAQAVKNAFLCDCEISLKAGIAAITSYERRGIAAAIRAAADQIEHHWDGAECVDHLQAIASELAGDPNPTTTEPTNET